MPKHYVTFGQDHSHTIGDVIFDKDCVATFWAPDAEEGRKKAFELFGPKFCFEYTEASFPFDSLHFYPRGLVEVPNTTLLVIAPGKTNGEGAYYILVADTGEALASHFCSHAGFAYGDLYENRAERKAEWTERFGALVVKYIDETDITPDTLLERNHKWAAAQKDEEE